MQKISFSVSVFSLWAGFAISVLYHA